jgi:SAM-dependent methyltransferase
MTEFVNEGHRTIFADTSHIAGWQMQEDSEALFELGFHHGDVLLEVGTYAGRSAACMLAGALSAGRRPKYYGVDISDYALGMTAATLKSRGLMPRSALFCGTLAQFSARFPIRCTAAFIDGGHLYEDVAADIAVLRRLLAPGTPVIFHDYGNPDTSGVKQAVDEAAADGTLNITGTPGCCAVTQMQRCEGHSAIPSSAEFWLRKFRMRPSHLRGLLTRARERLSRRISSARKRM